MAQCRSTARKTHCDTDHHDWLFHLIVVKTVSARGVTVFSDYDQSANALLNVPLMAYTSLVVRGTASLEGRLACTLPKGFNAAFGDRFTIISAGSVTGMFNNADGMIESGGHHFRILYGADKVELEKVDVLCIGPALPGGTTTCTTAPICMPVFGRGRTAFARPLHGIRIRIPS